MTTDIATTDTDRLIRLISFLEHDPYNLNLLLDTLSLAIASRDLEQAQRLVNHFEKHPIEDATCWAQMAYIQLLLRDFASASAYGDKAIQAGINDAAVLLNTAYGHFYIGNYDTSAAILAKLTSQSDVDVSTLLLHARSLHHQAKPEEAEQLLVRALQIESEHIEAKGLLSLLLYERDDNEAALRLAHDVLAHNPNQLDALLACGAVHFDQGNIEASRKTWRHTVNAYPTCGRAWSGLAQVEFHEMEFVDAETHLKTAVTFMPDHIGTWHLLAWIYILREESGLAREALDKSYALDRTFGETHGGLAVVDVLDGKFDDARHGIRRALKLNSECMSAHYAEMLMLQKAGKIDEANTLVQQVLERQAPNSNLSGRLLIERWLQAHQGKPPQPPAGQH